MSVILQIGCSSAGELHHRVGHVAGTLGGVNYESRGKRGCVRGSSARGAADRIFRHQFHRVLTDAEAAAAKRYADGCVGEPYRFGYVPSAQHGGDCSGFMSGIICAAQGSKIHRLFSTASWPKVYASLGFTPGLGHGFIGGTSGVGVLDRPFPGFDVRPGSTSTGHIRWIQARLDYADHAGLTVDGGFGRKTEEAVLAFQKHHHLDVDGFVGRNTWKALNAVR